MVAHELVIVLTVVLLAIGVSLLLHHGWKHSSDHPLSNAKQESCMGACYFQPKDVAHFETWILVCLFNALAVVLPCLIHSVAIGGASSVLFTVSFLGALAIFLMLVYLITIVVCCPCITCMDILHNISNHETWVVVSLTCALNVGWTLVHQAAQCSGHMPTTVSQPFSYYYANNLTILSTSPSGAP